MAKSYLVAGIVDLDNLSATSLVDNTNGTYDTTEIHIDCVNKKFYFKGAGNLASAGTGVTGQALYSFFKYIWKNTASITRYDFPMLSITNEQFEFINGWQPNDAQTVTQLVTITGNGDIDFDGANTITHSGSYDFRQFEVGDTISVSGTTNNNGTDNFTVTAVTKTTITTTEAGTSELNVSAVLTESFTTTTRELIRTAGWAEQDLDSAGSSNYNKITYAGLITLGSMVDVTDQPYYAQDSSYTASTINTSYTGPVNQAVRIAAKADAFSSGDNDITFGDGTGIITSTTTDLSVFKVGDIITVSNTTSNNTTFTITTVTSANSITVDSGANTTSEGPVGATITWSATDYFKIYVRERGKTYSDADLLDIGVSTMTYIVYRFPLSNATDLKIITTADTEIDSDSAVPASVDPYDDIKITYLTNPDTLTGRVHIVGAYENGFNYALGDVVQDVGDSMGNGEDRWYYVDASTGVSNGADMASDTAHTWTAWDDTYGEREISGSFYAFHTIIDGEDSTANTGTPYTASGGASINEVYEFSQWGLRLSGYIDEDNTTQYGNIADSLVAFIGDTLHTLPGVFVDSLKETDTNSIVFHDYSDATATYPLTVTVTINFNNNLSTDTDAVFYAYYSDLIGTNDFDTVSAIQVNKADLTKVGADITNNVPDGAAGSSYQFSYAYDEDTASGFRTVSTPVGMTVVAIGLNTGQYVKASGTVDNTGGTISLVAPLERNYSNP